MIVINRDGPVAHSGLTVARVWHSLVAEENNLCQHVSGLRKLLGSLALTTVPGRGYRFTLPLIDDTVEPATPSTANPINHRGLPANKPTLIGREDDLSAVLALLADTHLLTVVGAGGVGKTR